MKHEPTKHARSPHDVRLIAPPRCDVERRRERADIIDRTAELDSVDQAENIGSASSTPSPDSDADSTPAREIPGLRAVNSSLGEHELTSIADSAVSFSRWQDVAERLGVSSIDDVSNCVADPRFVSRISIQYARQHGVLGVDRQGQGLTLLTATLEDFDVFDVLARYLGVTVTPCLAPRRAIERAINQAYEQKSGETEELIGTIDRDSVLGELNQVTTREDLLETSSRAPVIKLVNLLLFEAVKTYASDVHIQPYEDTLAVRMRIDGVLFDMFTVPKAIQEEVASRVKILGNMNIAEKRLPQDGRATVKVGERVIDLRLSSVPTSHGERIVIRLLDKSARLYTLEEIGMDADTLTAFRELIRVEHGLVLVTGPTGSGKSTTLYAALTEINNRQGNIITLEDPIEYQLEGISQIQIASKKGMTFASGLRSVLRQDPDIIMVGEIRDEETAVMAIQSALTGHLVFSTLHTNDAASAVTRLLDLGIEPYLVASSVIGVLAQRLVRRICPNCAEAYAPSRREKQQLELTAEAVSGARVQVGRGCRRCRTTGYQGRVGLFELLPTSARIRELVSARATAAEIKDAALDAGMRALRDDGVEKVLRGATTIEEVKRVTIARRAS